MNRNGLESAAWRYASEGFQNILAITGDYPTGGFGGRAEPVFDFDSVALITLLRSMNEGLNVLGREAASPRRCRRPTSSSACVVSPFKRHERELVPQYYKLVRKIAAGAQWVDSAARLRHAEVPRGEAAPRSPRHQRTCP